MSPESHDESEAAEAELASALPAVSEQLEIDPLLLALLRCASFLDLAGDEVVNPELAGQVLEHVGMYMQRLSDEQLDDIQSQLESLEAHAEQQGWPADTIEFIRDFLYNCGLGEDDAEEPVGDA